jgi:hypothetical protein
MHSRLGAIRQKGRRRGFCLPCDLGGHGSWTLWPHARRRGFNRQPTVLPSPDSIRHIRFDARAPGCYAPARCRRSKRASSGWRTIWVRIVSFLFPPATNAGWPPPGVVLPVTGIFAQIILPAPSMSRAPLACAHTRRTIAATSAGLRSSRASGLAHNSRIILTTAAAPAVIATSATNGIHAAARKPSRSCAMAHAASAIRLPAAIVASVRRCARSAALSA